MNNEVSFTKADTNMIKGIAIMAMVFHHTYPNNTGLSIMQYESIDAFGVIAALCKVCVALLTLLSGYGLSESWSNKSQPPKGYRFFLSHYIQLLSLYWPVYLLCILFALFRGTAGPIDHFGGSGFSVFMDLLGLQMVTHTGSYIIDWYMTTIVVFYLLFPLIYKTIKQIGVWFLLITYTPWVYYLWKKDLSMHTDWWLFYLFAFSLGIYLSQRGLLSKWKEWACGKKGVTVLFGLFFLVSLFLRLIFALPMDSFVALGVTAFGTVALSKTKIVRSLFELAGRNSANIWLMHHYMLAWLGTLGFKNNASYAAVVFIICLGLSELLEQTKTILTYTDFVKKIRNKI